MKRMYTIVLLLLAMSSFVSGDLWAQRAKIVVEAVTPYTKSVKGWTSNVSSGLPVVPKGTVVYLSAKDLLGGTITSVSWVMQSRPTGSASTLDSTTKMWTTFKPDTTGQYTIGLTVTTSAGSHSTTLVITSAKFSGAGSVGGVTPNLGAGQCAGCHSGVIQPDKVTPWKTSGHADIFKEGITGQLGSSYASYCMPCHTIGYDTQPTSTNNGFDDQMTAVGWVFPPDSLRQPGRFDTLVARFPQLAQVATIGCEECHGPGSLHLGVTSKTAKSIEVGVCAKCHDAPTHHMLVRQWSNSLHSNPIYTSSYRQLPTSAEYRTNNLNNCVRCHDAQGFINLTKGKTTPTDSLFAFNLNPFGCTMCHEPHNATTAPHQLRKITADTLGNGFVIPTTVGNGGLCLNCHKSRRNGETYPVTTRINSTFGPHGSPQGDMFLGKNAHSWGQIIPSSVAHSLVEGACVGCHMAASPTSGVAANRIGGHSWSMSWADSANIEHDNVAKCVECHAGITEFSDIIAAFDYDGDGVIEPFINEMDGLRSRLAKALPPYNIDSVSWSLIASSPDSVRLKKAYYNYQFFNNDGSHGVHNPKYAISILQRSITTVTGVEFDNSWETPTEFVLAQNYPNPFNPSTTIAFSVPEEQHVRVEVFDILGRLVTTLVNEEMAVGNYKVTWNGSDRNGLWTVSGVYFYRLQARSFTSIKKMIMLK